MLAFSHDSGAFSLDSVLGKVTSGINKGVKAVEKGVKSGVQKTNELKNKAVTTAVTTAQNVKTKASNMESTTLNAVNESVKSTENAAKSLTTGWDKTKSSIKKAASPLTKHLSGEAGGSDQASDEEVTEEALEGEEGVLEAADVSETDVLEAADVEGSSDQDQSAVVQQVSDDPYDGLQAEKRANIDQRFSGMKTVLNLQDVDLRNVVAVQYVCDKLKALYDGGTTDLFIDLSNTGITEDGLLMFFECLKDCPKLIKSLFADGNNLPKTAAYIISRYLSSFPAIVALSLANNQLGDDGFLVFLDSLIKSKSKNNILQYLSLKNNAITEQCIVGAMGILQDLDSRALNDGIMLSGNQKPENVEVPTKFVFD